MFWKRIQMTGRPRKTPRTRHMAAACGVVRPDLGGEGRGGMARVVRLVLAAGAGEVAELAGGRDGGLDLGVRADPPAEECGDRRRDER